MINKKDIETERTIVEFRNYVTIVKSIVNDCKEERHKGIVKKGIYKVFVDEIIPLSLFCIKNYPENYRVLPKLGDQGYDAIIKDEDGNHVEYLEITSPHDGLKEANDAKLVVGRGYGETETGDSGDDLRDMFSIVLGICNKKAIKDYSDCSLVIVIDFSPPFKEEEPTYKQIISELEEKIVKIKFNVKKIYLLVIPLGMVKRIYG
ncbi:MAG: hypothetical protein PHX56_08860 [Atribacterota bacterium]|nr:hypothetical protein [Atribacterota bacterium]